MHPLLETRRSNPEPKCASCGWWQGGANSAGTCERHGVKTLDLMACTDWREGDALQEILAPENSK